MKISELRKEIYGVLSAQEERLILSHVLQVREEELFLDGIVPQSQVEKVKEVVELRKQGVPLAYIFQEAQFYGRTFYVNEHVLIPREETQMLVKKGLEFDPSYVLDLCTGSGILATTFALESKATVTGSDISPLALKVAKKNAQDLGAKVIWIESDLFDKIKDRYDLILSNPPYIDREVLKTLDVAKYEPVLALEGGEEGMDYYRRILSESMDYLLPGGHLLLEIGYDQGEKVRNLGVEKGFINIEVQKDLAGYDRMVHLQKRE